MVSRAKKILALLDKTNIQPIDSETTDVGKPVHLEENACDEYTQINGSDLTITSKSRRSSSSSSTSTCSSTTNKDRKRSFSSSSSSSSSSSTTIEENYGGYGSYEGGYGARQAPRGKAGYQGGKQQRGGGGRTNQRHQPY